MFFASNIKFLRKRKGSTQDEVASSLNMKRSTLSGYENEVAQPNMETLLSFSNYFNIAIDTLIKIDLSVVSGFYLSQLETGTDLFLKGSNIRVLATTVDKKNSENIELVPEKANASYRKGYADPEYLKTLQTFQLPFLSKEKKYRSFQVCGDSMLPLPEGSWITGEFVRDWYSLRNRHVYIILTMDDGIIFKVVENKIIREGKLTLHSFNPVYQPFDIAVNDIKEVWKFINYISSELPQQNTFSDNLTRKINILQTDIEQMKKHIGISGKLFGLDNS